VSLTAEHIHNNPGISLPAILRGDCRLMDTGTFSLWLQMPLNTPELSLQSGGSLTAMNLGRLNPYLEVAGRARIKSGVLQHASFQSEIHGDHALGDLRGQYHDLHLVLLDPKTGQEGGLLTKIKTALTDRIVLRTSNLPDPKGLLATGRIDYTRRSEEGFLHFLWFSLRSGIVDLIGISDVVRQAR